MKFLVTFVALVAAVASASIGNTFSSELDQIIAAINSPSTDPATAAALEQMLIDLVGQESGIVVGPAIIEPQPSPVAIVEEAENNDIIPTPVQVVDDASPINPSPVVVGPIAAGSTPLVQIILNIKSASDVEISPEAVVAPETDAIHPVVIVDDAAIAEDATVIDPVVIVDKPTIVDPVQIVDKPTIVDPIQIVDKPTIVDPIQIVDVPALPTPAINIPAIMN